MLGSGFRSGDAVKINQNITGGNCYISNDMFHLVQRIKFSVGVEPLLDEAGPGPPPGPRRGATVKKRETRTDRTQDRGPGTGGLRTAENSTKVRVFAIWCSNMFHENVCRKRNVCRKKRKKSVFFTSLDFFFKNV